jgi:hypothetical protein
MNEKPPFPHCPHSRFHAFSVSRFALRNSRGSNDFTGKKAFKALIMPAFGVILYEYQ